MRRGVSDMAGYFFNFTIFSTILEIKKSWEKLTLAYKEGGLGYVDPNSIN
jgi:hypothetical protein